MREGTSAILSHFGLDEKRWSDSLNAVAICEMSKIFWQMGKFRMNEDSGNQLMDQSFHSAHQWNISQIPRETEREFNNSERGYDQEFFRMCFDRGENLEGRHSDC